MEVLLGFENSSNTKDKINLITKLLGLIFGLALAILFFLESFDDFQLLIYPLGLIFLIWFATRRNGCGSCNQVSRT